jgi:TRAP-type C4-dicarboxylate transport system permease small subunit
VKYPLMLEKINRRLAFFAGAVILATGVLAVFESISRTFFNSPTVWSIDFSVYIFIWAIFLGSPFAYQENGHVAVDLIRDIVERRGGKTPRRVMAVAGYVFAEVTIFVLLYAAVKMAKFALSSHQITIALIQIPVFFLDMAMIVGSIMMAVTLIFIILDLFVGGEKYL